VFAILGLRAMYFLLAGVMNTFYYLSHGLSLVLVFIGAKMLTADFFHLPIATSLAVVAIILGVAVGASLVRNMQEKSRRRLQEGKAAPSAEDS
jgi:tellurite resistance protein TerC